MIIQFHYLRNLIFYFAHTKLIFFMVVVWPKHAKEPFQGEAPFTPSGRSVRLIEGNKRHIEHWDAQMILLIEDVPFLLHKT